MATSSADAVEFQPGMRRRRIRWRRYIGLSVPALIGLVVARGRSVRGFAADPRSGVHRPRRAPGAAGIRRRHLGPSAGHRRTRPRHLQPLAAWGARLSDRRRDRRPWRRVVRDADRAGLRLGRRNDRSDPDARGRPAVGLAGDSVCGTDGQPGRSQPDQCDRHLACSGPGPRIPVWFAPMCSLCASATLSRPRDQWAPRPGGSCASISCQTCSTPS